MKIKQIYISDENFNNLKGINASALINEFLNKHFETLEQTKKLNEKTPEELQKELELLEAKLKIENELKKL